MRRTSSIDMTWPGGRGTQLRMVGWARDLLTTGDGRAEVLALDSMRVGIGADRTIDDISVAPDRPVARQVVGARGGGGMRSVLANTFPVERQRGSPLWLLLDDIAGASLIAGFAWSRHVTDWLQAERPGDRAGPPPAPRRMEGVCAGFRPGASTLRPDGTPVGGGHNVVPVPPLADPGDPIGFHELEPVPEVAMRRSRRIDVWVESGEILVDAMFRDSTWDPDGTEVAVHEYRIDATVDPATGDVRHVVAEPRVLPYSECPAAAPNVSWLVGEPIQDFRRRVLEVLRGPDCCTHLNDALRSMAEVPILARTLGLDLGERI